MSFWLNDKSRLQMPALILAIACGSGAAFAQQASGPAGPYRFGAPATDGEVAAWKADARPDGLGLPAGSGAYQQGAQVYADQCAACHGADLHGISDKNLPQGGGPALIGGRGTLATPKPVQTVESYWPYSVTLFDYIHRAMPYTAPGALGANETYAVVAYILGQANIIDKNTLMDAASLPKVLMPNRDGFYPDDRPFPVRSFSSSNYSGVADAYPAQVKESAGPREK